MPLDQALPRELLVLVIAQHMHERPDVKRLSLTSRFFFSLIRSPELVAALLWQRRGDYATFLAMDKTTWRCSGSSSRCSVPTSTCLNMVGGG